MSSFKKASKINQKTHRERHQPEERKQLGLLEKKKDYKVRADHFNKRKKTLKILRKKALERNEDEFHTHMINASLVDGEHFDKPEKSDEDSEEQKLLMESQDLRYVSSRRTIEKKKIEKIKSRMHMIDAANHVPNTHVFFVDDEKEAKHFDIAKQLNTVPELLSRKTNRMSLEALNKFQNIGELHRKRKRYNTLKQYERLNRRVDREKNLSVIERKLQINKLLKQSQKKDEKPKMVKRATQNSAPVYKWKYERKK